MYNDYYLQQIYNELGILEDIEENQETIIQYQELIESGDRDILNQLKVNNMSLILVTIVLTITLLYNFIVRCLK